MSCYIQNGKYGDVLGILPILYHEFQTTGIKPQLVIAKDYADILDGVSYVEPVIYDGNFADLRGAIKFAKKRFDEVIVLQTHGNDFPIEHKTASFQLDAWVRAGCVESFDDWPLVFDQRNGRRERTLFMAQVKRTEKKNRPFEKFILLADHSESSPFPQADELAETLKREFGGTHKIIRLSEVRAEKPFDLLALYDKAECLVTIETMHGHLSKASKVPTIMLSTDGWRGTAPHKKFAFYCKYSDYPKRKLEIVELIKNIVTGMNPTNNVPTPTGSVSAVIPIFKPGAAMLNRCLEAVLPQVAEVIITREQAGIVPEGIMAHPKIKVVAAGESGIGFGKNVNFGARYATSDFLLILNDDVYLAPDAVEKMLREMKDGVGAVYPLLRYPNGVIYCGGKKFTGPNGGHIDYHQMTPTIVVPTEMDDMNGAAILVRRVSFEQVGGFDEQIKFYMSDDDLAMKLRQADWKLIYTPFATGVHDGHQETKTAPFNVMEELKRAQALFGQKWQAVFDRNKGSVGLLKFK